MSHYRRAPIRARWHTAIRWRLLSFPTLAAWVPSHGTAVDLGCGYGLWSLYLARCRPGQPTWGVDPDASKIAVARRVSEEGRVENIHFATGRAQDIDLPVCTSVSFIDVMYLIPFQAQEEILARAVGRLEPGGRLLLKEMGQQPRWKYTWNLLEERLAVNVLRITYGDHFYFRLEREWVELLSGLGLRVQTIAMDTGYVHPHRLFVGEKS